jgi:hypothetical protein
MQETWELDLTNAPINFVDEFKGEEIKRTIKENVKELEILLSYYFKGEGGLVEKVTLTDNINFMTPTTGTFKVKFKVVYFNACWDIHSDDEEQMILNFDVNLLQKKMRLTGPLWPEREPDEI